MSPKAQTSDKSSAKVKELVVTGNSLQRITTDSISPEMKYLHIVVLVSALAIGGYCSFEYVRQGLIEYLVAAVIGGLVFSVSFLSSLTRKPVLKEIPAFLPQALLTHNLFKKYKVILEDIKKFESHKRNLLEETITGQLKELIESRLPLMLSRRDSYSQY